MVTTQITNKLQVFVYRCLRRILGTRRPEVVCNVELWETAGEEPGASQIKKRNWRWLVIRGATQKFGEFDHKKS
jgi:hypothetical protein